MILGKSIDKAQIKKIPIRVWSLTEEINATLKVLNEEYQNKIPEDKLTLIKAFYEATSPAELNKKPKLTLIDGGKNELPQQPQQVAPVPTASTTLPTPVTAPMDDFEAAKLLEVEAQKAAQNQAAAPTQAANIAEQKVQDTLQNINPNNTTNIPLDTASKTVETSPVATIQVAPAPVQPVIVPSHKTYTTQDFLNLRKEGVRIYPEESHISNGHCIIYDINFDQMLFFTEKAFKPGQEIIIEFSIHKTFTVTAKVISITNVGVGSRVLTSRPINYRINAALTHEHLGDRTLIRNFLTKVDPLINTAT